MLWMRQLFLAVLVVMNFQFSSSILSMVKGTTGTKNKVLELYSAFENASEYHFVCVLTALGLHMLYGCCWTFHRKQKENA